MYKAPIIKLMPSRLASWAEEATARCQWPWARTILWAWAVALPTRSLKHTTCSATLPKHEIFDLYGEEALKGGHPSGWSCGGANGTSFSYTFLGDPPEMMFEWCWR